MPNILTVAEAANFIRTDTTDAVMLMLLPQVDAFIKRATGRDWTLDGTINPIAKAAAVMLLVQWYDNPAQAFGESTAMSFGLTATLTQLEAEALKYRKSVFAGLSNAGSILLAGARKGDDVISLVGVYGVSGSQAANFESEISIEGQIQQTASSDLSENVYVVILKHPADDVVP